MTSMKSEEFRILHDTQEIQNIRNIPHHNNMQKLFQVVPVVVKIISKYPHFKDGNFVKSIIISSHKC